MDSNGFQWITRSRTPPSLASDPPICRQKTRPLEAMPGLPEDLTDHSLRQAVGSWSAVPGTSESAIPAHCSQRTLAKNDANICEHHRNKLYIYIYVSEYVCDCVCVFLFLVFMLCSINVPSMLSMFQMSDWVPWLHILLGTLCKSFQRR